MAPHVDLSRLMVSREAPPVASRPVRRRRLTRLVLPAALLLGFAALVLSAAREVLSPPRAVTVMPVVVARSGEGAPADTPLFRAAGWAEPRPTPTVVTALAEGVVEKLLVVEGQEVKAGQTVARLIADDARLALEAGEAEVELREGELASARAVLVAARDRHELPTHLMAELADAESALAKAESDLEIIPGAVASAEARLEYAERELNVQKRSGEAVARIGMDKALTDRAASSGSLRELQSRRKRLPVEIAALKARREALKSKLERKVDETRQLGEGEAGVKAGTARLRQAKAGRDVARLRLDRMDVKAPTGGKVLGLIARPGTRLNGLTASSLQDSSTVLTMYDPASLQVRVDVRLDDVSKVRPGQKARIESAALPDAPMAGEVLFATSQADVQKNTLSVKVAIHAPPAGLRPEMLCQVTFLAPPLAAARGEDTVRVMVPRQLLDGPSVWVADQATGTAKRRAVEIGAARGELVEVLSGLGAQDRLIVRGREGLSDGARIRVEGEDDSLGNGR